MFSIVERTNSSLSSYSVLEMFGAGILAIVSMYQDTDNVYSTNTADDEIIDTDVMAERARVKGAVNEVSTTAATLLKLGDGLVLWYEPTFSTLHLAPLSVSDVLRENMLKQTPVIATSATLTVGNSFNSLAKSIGFIVGEDLNAEVSEGELDPGNLQMLDVGSPFDFANQGVLYMPKHLPEPGRDGPSIEVLTELGELIDAAGGRTLALFSSWRGVEAADAHLRKVLAELPIKIITQKRGDAVGPLVSRFAKDETSILKGPGVFHAVFIFLPIVLCSCTEGV